MAKQKARLQGASAQAWWPHGKLYTYYQTSAQKAPDLFLWMGLGHLAGGTIVSGLDQGLAPDLVQQTLLANAKAIFLDLG